MKRIIIVGLIAFSFLFTETSLAQNQSQTNSNKHQLPPISELPEKGKSKTFYEFDKVYSYEMFGANGKRIKEGNTKFVDVTELPKGTYFFNYNNQYVRYKKD